MTEDELTLGNRYSDPISGWEGTATARYEYLNGCVRVELSGADKDGKPDAYVFDVQQLVAVDQPSAATVERRESGGPQSNRPVPR